MPSFFCCGKDLKNNNSFLQEELMTRVKKGLLLGFLAEILLVTLVFLLYFYGVVLLNNPSREVYPVRGVDVSAHQGVIDWEV